MRAILTWHSIDSSGSPISTPPEVFARQVAYLASGRVEVVPLDWITQRPHHEDVVALSFDDAFENFATEAWPLLSAAGLPVTVFVVSGRCAKDNRWGELPQKGIPTLPLLDWESLAQLAEDGVELGAHSRTHPDLRSVPEDQLDEELGACREEISKRTGQDPTSFAYPYGHEGEALRRRVAQDFDLAVTTDHRLLEEKENPLALPRLDCCYFQKRGAIESFGSARFARGVRQRHFLRRLRSIATR